MKLQKANDGWLKFERRTVGLVLSIFLLFATGLQAANRPPVISVPDSQWVAEGDRLSFGVTATDPDVADLLQLSDSLEGASSLPPGAQFEQSHIDSGTFTELKGPPGMSLLNYRLVGVDGETGDLYATAIIFSLSQQDTVPIPPDGYYVIAHDSSVANWDLINEAIDWRNAEGTGDNILLLSPEGDTLDALGYGPSDTSTWFFCGEESPAPDVPRDYSLGRYPDGTDTDDNSVDFSSYASPTPGVSNGSPKGESKSSLVINEVRYETSHHYEKGNFTWQPDYGDEGVYKFIFIVEDNGSPPLADTAEVVVTVTHSAPDTVIALENYAASGQQNVSLPVYLANPYHFIRGIKVNVECEAMKFDSVDFTSSCLEDFSSMGYQFNNDSTIVSVSGYDSAATVPPGAGRKLFFTLRGEVRSCAQSAPFQFITFGGYECQLTDTLGINTYYPVEIDGDLVITDSHPDTVSLSFASVSPGDSTQLPVYLKNPDHSPDSIYVELQMPLPWGLEVNFSRIDTTGTCLSGFNYFDYGVLNWPNLRIAFFEARAAGGSPLNSSSAKRLLFNVVVTADTTVDIDTTFEVDLINSTTVGQSSCAYNPWLINGSLRVGGGPTFIRGDYNCDGAMLTNDPLMELQFIFGVPGSTPPSCVDGADYNDDGSVLTNDPLMALQYIFGVPGSTPPPPPYPDCGMDPTEDELDCLSSPFCMGGKGLAYKPSLSVKGAENRLVAGEPVVEDGLVRVPIELTVTEPVCGLDISLGYDASALRFKEVVGGEGYDFWAVDTRQAGVVRIGAVPDIEMAKLLEPGRHRVGEVVFEVVGKGDMGLRWQRAEVYGADVQPLSMEWVAKAGSNLPTQFALSQNYPNPFNPSTQIRYALPVDCQVRLEVYNVVGQRVATLVDGHQKAGYKVATWNAQDMASGVYFYRLTAGNFTSIHKMVLLK